MPPRARCFPPRPLPPPPSSFPARAAAGFVLPDLAGSTVRLRALAGRVVLVHFFATWCEPCRAELSSLSQAHEQSGGGPFAVLAINVAEVPARVRRFIDTSPVT